MSDEQEPVDMMGDTTVPNIALLCMQQMNRDASWTANQLVSGYQREVARLRAEIELIRRGVEKAFSQPWAPNESFVLGQLWPSRESILKLAKQDKDWQMAEEQHWTEKEDEENTVRSRANT